MFDDLGQKGGDEANRELVEDLTIKLAVACRDGGIISLATGEIVEKLQKGFISSDDVASIVANAIKAGRGKGVVVETVIQGGGNKEGK